MQILGLHPHLTDSEIRGWIPATCFKPTRLSWWRSSLRWKLEKCYTDGGQKLQTVHHDKPVLLADSGLLGFFLLLESLLKIIWLYVRVYSWALCSITLLIVSDFMPGPPWFDYCSSAVTFEIRKDETSHFSLFQDSFGYSAGGGANFFFIPTVKN